MAAGSTSGLKGIGKGLAEWRIDWGPGIRLYMHQDGLDLVVMLGGSEKGDQAAEIRAASALALEYKKRKKILAGVADSGTSRRHSVKAKNRK